ncbi:MAG: hypothetical protein FLDDKLPJ_02204 [Phycisphaerae bacterium]|nr:hypothetical protein [Phycisphaerae bacterium]
MLTFPTANALIVTALFIVPGFIWSTVHASLIPRRATETQARLIEYLTLSCVNHAPWFWLFGLLFATDFGANHPGWAGFLLLIPGIISPIMFGLISGRMWQRDWPKKVLGKYGFRTLNQIPTAWDYQFSRAKPYWVIVTLRDGSRILGLFGGNSYASDDPKERDIFVEAVYTLRGDGEWLPVEGSGGIIVKGEQIAAIEFRKLDEIDYGKE